METSQLKYRVISEADAAFLFELMNTDKWHSYIGDRKIRTEEDARNYIRANMSAELSQKGFINHVMVDKKTNIPVGTCSLHDRPGVEGLDVGYALLPTYEGRGFATEGATLMVKLAFSRFQQKLISAITTDENIRSCRVLEKIGFQHQSYVRLPNGKEELKLYVLEQKDFDG